MPVRRALTGLALALLFTSPAGSDDLIRVEVKRGAKTNWRVEQTLKLASKSKGKRSLAGGAGTAQMLVKGTVTTKEKWTDKAARFTDGKLVELHRKYSVSKIKGEKGGAKPTTLDAALVLYERKDDGWQMRARNDTHADLCVDLLSASPVDPVELLLPPEPVRVGSSWELDAEQVMHFQKSICIGLSAAKGKVRSQLTLLFEALGKNTPASAAVLVHAKLASVKRGVATIRFEHDKEVEKASSEPRKGPLFEEPASKTTVEGVLTFDLKQGRPIKLTWKQVHDMGDFKVPGASVTVPGFTETWTLTKSWK